MSGQEMSCQVRRGHRRSQEVRYPNNGGPLNLGGPLNIRGPLDIRGTTYL